MAARGTPACTPGWQTAAASRCACLLQQRAAEKGERSLLEVFRLVRAHLSACLECPISQAHASSLCTHPHAGLPPQVRIPEGCLLLQAGKQMEWLTGGAVKAGFHEVGSRRCQGGWWWDGMECGWDGMELQSGGSGKPGLHKVRRKAGRVRGLVWCAHATFWRGCLHSVVQRTLAL